MDQFVGRARELGELNRLLRKESASLVVVKGRRRVGKSRLVAEFAKQAGAKFYTFTGIPPVKGTTAQDQRNHFVESYLKQFGSGLDYYSIKAHDWYPLFMLLAESIGNERTIVLLDEISWMGSKDVNFLGKLKTVWDTAFSRNPKLILVLCGSVSAWIEKNIISSTAFFGRINLKITLGVLSLPECDELLRYKKFNKSPMEKFMILSVTGGIPWYIENIDGSQSAADNIKRLCYEADGLLVNEFKYIFDDIFRRRRIRISRKIVECLAKGPAEFNDIAKDIQYSGGSLTDYLNDLEEAGFISKDFSWDFKTGDVNRVVLYRLKDNYLRFYLKYIAPRLAKIKKGHFALSESITAFPGWESIMGLQFENLALNNHALIMKKIGINPSEVVFDNPYLQRKTLAQEGCQIDYLIQTKYNTLYVCEIKFSQHPVGLSVIKEVKNKIESLKRPRGFACIPVLLEVNGVDQTVLDHAYFETIIDFGDLLKA